MLRHPIALSSGRMPLWSTCSIIAPFSTKYCTYEEKQDRPCNIISGRRGRTVGLLGYHLIPPFPPLVMACVPICGGSNSSPRVTNAVRTEQQRRPCGFSFKYSVTLHYYQVLKSKDKINTHLKKKNL